MHKGIKYVIIELCAESAKCLTACDSTEAVGNRRKCQFKNKLVCFSLSLSHSLFSSLREEKRCWNARAGYVREREKETHALVQRHNNNVEFHSGWMSGANSPASYGGPAPVAPSYGPAALIHAPAASVYAQPTESYYPAPPPTSTTLAP